MLREVPGLCHLSRWGDVRKRVHGDPRCKAVDSRSLREEWFKEYISALDDFDSEDEERKERERQERIEASLKKRNEEVARSLSTSLRERDKEREQHKKDEAIQHFGALLADMVNVRNCDASWRETRKHLRKDHRWGLTRQLSKDEKQRLFEDHIQALTHKNKVMFHKLLDDTELSLTSTWKEVRRRIKDDPRCVKFSSSDRKREKEFVEYLSGKFISAKTEFREFLKETKAITYRTKRQLDNNQLHLEEIEKILANDKRYLTLDCIPEDRHEILMQHIEEMARKGPPPPPTASEPNRRTTK